MSIYKVLADKDYVNEVFNNIPNSDDNININTATAGQIIEVKSVDENGKPTEWESVDPWVITSSTEGSTKQFKLTIDDDGTLSITEIVEEEAV